MCKGRITCRVGYYARGGRIPRTAPMKGAGGGAAWKEREGRGRPISGIDGEGRSGCGFMGRATVRSPAPPGGSRCKVG